MTTSTDKLKPCINCNGGRPIIKGTSFFWNASKFYIQCTCCSFSTGVYTSVDIARTAWNQQHTPTETKPESTVCHHAIKVGDNIIDNKPEKAPVTKEPTSTDIGSVYKGVDMASGYDTPACVIHAQCPVTGQIVALTEEQLNFFKPWMHKNTYALKYCTPLVPPTGYRFLRRDEGVIKGDKYWFDNCKWEESRNWQTQPKVQASPNATVGPYIRKITNREYAPASTAFGYTRHSPFADPHKAILDNLDRQIITDPNHHDATNSIINTKSGSLLIDSESLQDKHRKHIIKTY
jgi:hypothetical protein